MEKTCVTIIPLCKISSKIQPEIRFFSSVKSIVKINVAKEDEILKCNPAKARKILCTILFD